MRGGANDFKNITDFKHTGYGSYGSDEKTIKQRYGYE
jgi:hypothetical protein